MRNGVPVWMCVTLLLGACSTPALASYCGATGLLARRNCRSTCDSCQRGCCRCQCHTVMKTITKTVYDEVTEPCEKVVYDTVYDHSTETDVHRIAETHYRQEEFTYQRPVYESRTQEVPYAVSVPVYETRSKDVHYTIQVPSFESRSRSVPYTTYRQVVENCTRTISYCVPRQVCYTKTIQVPSGHWETRTEECPGPVRQKCVREPGCWKWDPCCCRCVYVPGKCHTVEVQCPPIKVCKRVWVPSTKECQVTAYKTVYDTKTMQVPYTVTHQVPETHTREVPYTIVKMVPVPQTRTVYYRVARMTSEQRTRTVSHTVQHMVTETGTRTVPYTTWQEVPVTRNVCVPRQVPRTVKYTVTRCVPRTVTCQVAVRVCCPVPKCCDSRCGCDGDSDAEASPADTGPELDGPPPVPELDDTKSARAPSGLLTVAIQVESTAASGTSGHYSAGLRHYWNGRYEQAVSELTAATAAAPASPRHAYFLALALYQANRMDEAERALDTAIQIEQSTPIAGWGRLMERVQGQPRLWMEQRRTKA